jgi:hypothetical protein
VKSLKAKVALLLFGLAMLSAIPAQLHADGNPFPTCNGKSCPSPN